MSKIRSINPHDDSVIAEYELFTDQQVDVLIRNAQDTFEEDWRTSTFEDRSRLMRLLAKYLLEKKEVFAQTMTQEMGKAIDSSRAEVEKCAWCCDFYAEHAQEFLKDEVIETDASQSYVVKDPFGIILAVMPWNFPLWQVVRFLAPTIMAGNVCLLKHASNVPKTAMLIEQAIVEVGFPDGVFTTLLIKSDQVESVIRNRHVRAVTLTGSEAAGASVAQIAGSEIKKLVLELGGSDPFIVLPGADLDRAAKVGVEARLLNCGQSCIAAKRFIIHKDVYNEFIEIFTRYTLEKRVGDPTDPENHIGPLANAQILEELEWQVEKSVSMGAEVITGGRRLDIGGNYYSPTILTEVDENMPVLNSETFGPVAAVKRVGSVDEAVRVANKTDYGLGASIWTDNIDLAKKLARRIDSGGVFINGLVKSDPRLPFGGIKRSGFGRELGSYGINEFVNVKTVWVK